MCTREFFANKTYNTAVNPWTELKTKFRLISTKYSTRMVRGVHDEPHPKDKQRNYVNPDAF